MRIDVEKPYFILILLFIFSCNKYKEASYVTIQPEEDAIALNNDDKDIHEFINFLFINNTKDSITYLAQETSTDWVKNHFQTIYTLNDFVDLQKNSSRILYELSQPIEEILNEEEFKTLLIDAVSPYIIKSEYLSEGIILLEEAFIAHLLESSGEEIKSMSLRKISKPAFFQEKKFCFVYISNVHYYGGMVIGGGGISIFEKVDGKWKDIVSIPLWMGG